MSVFSHHLFLSRRSHEAKKSRQLRGLPESPASSVGAVTSKGTNPRQLFSLAADRISEKTQKEATRTACDVTSARQVLLSTVPGARQRVRQHLQDPGRRQAADTGENRRLRADPGESKSLVVTHPALLQ